MNSGVLQNSNKVVMTEHDMFVMLREKKFVGGLNCQDT